MEADKQVEAVQFKEKPAKIRLDAAECETERGGKSITRDILFTDYSGPEPRVLTFEASLTPVMMDRKKSLMRKCTANNRSGVPEIDWERMDDLIIAETLGLSEEQWKQFKKTHPIGLYTKITLLVKEVNGEISLSQGELDSLKNPVGQEQ